MTTGNTLTPFIDYDDYYAAVGTAIGSGETILVSGWALDIETPVGPTPTQQKIGELLAHVGAAGGRVRVLLSGHQGNPNADSAAWINKQKGCAAILDDRLRAAGCFHQKVVAISSGGGVVAYVGGMDFGRDRLRHKDPDHPEILVPPWHDVQVKLTGAGAADIYATLAHRWESHRANKTDRLPHVPVSGGARRGPGCAAQVVRTYGNPRTGIPLTVKRPENFTSTVGPGAQRLDAANEFAFAPTGESAIHDLLVQGIRSARETIYVEDQYFIASAAIGGDQELVRALAETIAKPTFRHMVVLTTGVGTVQKELFQVNQRRRDLVRRIVGSHRDRFSIWAYKGGQDRCSWLHSKMWIFDDTMAVIGSANFNRRGLSHDGEIAVGVVDLADPTRGWVHGLRKRLWLKHLTTPSRPVSDADVADFSAGRALWVNTKDTLLEPMDTDVGDPNQPDRLLVCSEPGPSPIDPTTSMAALFYYLACQSDGIIGKQFRSYDNQWNLLLDPDGT
ncbi:hypothetical protein EEB14_49460 [Rhodococcus sp. WS4]|nr:hypothetical protein EEB14_49460 [Rhodococcus sp. WS4]